MSQDIPKTAKIMLEIHACIELRDTNVIKALLKTGIKAHN